MLVDRVFALSKRLKWVQALGTGVDNLIDLPSLPKDAIVTNLHGIHGPPLSEAAIRRDAAAVAADASFRARAGQAAVGALAVDAAQRQDRRHLRRRRDRGGRLRRGCKAFNMKVVGITSARARRSPASTRCARAIRPARCRPRSRLSRAADAADAGHARHRRCEGARRDEADVVPGQSRARRRGRRGGTASTRCGAPDRGRRRSTCSCRSRCRPTAGFWELDNVFLTPHLGGFNDSVRRSRHARDRAEYARVPRRHRAGRHDERGGEVGLLKCGVQHSDANSILRKLSAPEGPWTVATGEAQRNPWRSRFRFVSAPEGRRN